MTAFTMEGTFQGRTVHLHWDDGTVTGDPDAVEMVEGYAKAWEGGAVNTLAGVTRHDHLSDPYSSVRIMEMVIGLDAKLVAGSLPEIPEPPKGAVM